MFVAAVAANGSSCCCCCCSTLLRMYAFYASLDHLARSCQDAWWRHRAATDCSDCETVEALTVCDSLVRRGSTCVRACVRAPLQVIKCHHRHQRMGLYLDILFTCSQLHVKLSNPQILMHLFDRKYTTIHSHFIGIYISTATKLEFCWRNIRSHLYRPTRVIT